MTFKENNYLVIKNLLSDEMAEVSMDYIKMKRDVFHCMYEQNLTHPAAVHNYWYYNKDYQVEDCYVTYGDVLMDNLLLRVKPIIEEKTGYELIETYSYTRIYEKGAELLRHKDRSACEVSLTLNLGGDPWDIWIDPSGQEGQKGTSVLLSAGDALVYKGNILEHWRDPFEGDECYQTFFHYADKNGPFGEEVRYDNRPMLGFPE